MATKATAHKIAQLVYEMLRDTTEHVERTVTEFECEYLARKIAKLNRQAAAGGLILAAGSAVHSIACT